MSTPPPLEVPQQLAMARKAWTKLRRLSAYAAFDGWSLAILGGLTLLFGGYASLLGLMLSLALLGAGLFEIRSVRQLRHLDPHAIGRMAYNQLVLGGVLMLYATISLMQSRSQGMPADIAQMLPADGSADGVNQMFSTAINILYIGLIVFALVVQGGTALYYFSRINHLKAYLKEAPEWIQQIQRERGEVSI